MKALDVVDDPTEDEVKFEEVPRAGLLVVFADPDSRQVLWVGAADAELMEEPSVELSKKRIAYAIKKMFKKFPH
jgi:hypothetical protein